MAREAWNPKKQLGELTLKLRSQRTGDVLEFPTGVKIGVVARGRRGASRERQYAIVGNGRQPDYKRSASEAAVAAQDMHREIEAEQLRSAQY